jgi:hypothetical protein
VKAKPGKTPDLTEAEMVEILKTIAREGQNSAARIAAIKTLREIRNGEKPSDSTFAQLDELAPKRRVRKRAASAG